MLTTPPEMDVSCPAYKSWIDNGPLHLNNIIEIGKPIDFGTGITIFKIKSSINFVPTDPGVPITSYIK